MEGRATSVWILGNRYVSRIPGSGAANCLLSWYIPGMGTLVEGGMLCAVAGSRPPPASVPLEIQNSRHWNCSFRYYCRRSDCMDCLVPITLQSRKQRAAFKTQEFGPQRLQPDGAPHVGFTELELYLLDTLIRNKTDGDKPTKSLGTYLIKLARLGGYLARAHDPPPGNKVMWRGLTRLTDIELGAIIGAQLVGN